MKIHLPISFVSVSLLLSGCAASDVAAPAAAPKDPVMQSAVQAVNTYHARNGRWPVSLSEVGFTDRAYSYEAGAGGFRIGHDGASYDSRHGW